MQNKDLEKKKLEPKINHLKSPTQTPTWFDIIQHLNLPDQQSG